MDWNSLLSTIAIIVFIVLMMRGCGGMMAGGGCGMGTPRRRDKAKLADTSPTDSAVGDLTALLENKDLH